MKRTVSVAFIALLLVLSLVPLKPQAQITPIQAGARFSVSVKGMKQGQFKGEGNVPGPGGKDQMLGIRFSMQANAPTNIATGLRTGARQFSPVTFTKLWGPASPQFLQALSTNETLSSVTFQFKKASPTGQELIFQEITLTNATVTTIRRYISVPAANEPPDARELEDISLTFQKIELSDKAQGGTTFLDEWTTRM